MLELPNIGNDDKNEMFIEFVEEEVVVEYISMQEDHIITLVSWNIWFWVCLVLILMCVYGKKMYWMVGWPLVRYFLEQH